VIIRFSLLAVAAAASLPIEGEAPAFTLEATAPDDAQARLAKSRELVAILNPRPAMIEKNMQGWEAGLRKSLSMNPGAIKVEAEYPGVLDAAVDAGRPLARTYCERFVDASTEEKTKVFAERLALGEVQEALGFFSSGAGKRFTAALLANADPALLAEQAALDARTKGKTEIGANDLEKVLQPAAGKALEAASAEDLVEFMRFSRNPVAAKIAQAGAESDRLILARANNPDPEFLRQQNDVITAAIVKFVDAKKR